MKYPVDHLLLWGIVLHLIADWLFQNEWMSVNKAKRREKFRLVGTVTQIDSDPPLPNGGIARQVYTNWWDRHPAAYVHAGIHGAIQLLIFPWWAALFIGVIHLLIDTRKPLAWWSQSIRQTQPSGTIYDIGTEVRIWADQVCHIAVVAIAALLVVA